MSSGAPIEKGVPIRYPSTALLCVNSEDGEIYDKSTQLRLNVGNPSQIYINNQQPALNGYMTRLALTEMLVHWATPNVNARNNTLTVGVYNTGTGAFITAVRISITTEFYTGPSLGVAVATALNANVTLTAQFGANTFGVTFGGRPCGTFLALAGQTVDWLSTADYVISTSTVNPRAFAFLPYDSPITGLPILTDDLTNMMGITPTATTPQYYTTLQGGYASLQYTPYIDITSSLLTKNQNVRDGTSEKRGAQNLLARVYFANEDFLFRAGTVTYAAGTGAFAGSTDNAIGCRAGSFRREFKFPKQIQWNTTENVDVIDIQVLDYRGNPLFYSPSATVLIPGNTVQISNTADLMFSIQATEI